MPAKFTIPSLPPSANNAYTNMRGGHGRVLTKEGKKYKTETAALLAQKFQKELKYFIKNEPHLVFFRLHFNVLENTTWGAAKKSAESRYKKTDVSNRIKLLEDVLKDVTGVDDSNTLTFIIQKVENKNEEKTEVLVWNTYREESPFDELLAGL